MHGFISLFCIIMQFVQLRGLYSLFNSVCKAFGTRKIVDIHGTVWEWGYSKNKRLLLLAVCESNHKNLHWPCNLVGGNTFFSSRGFTWSTGQVCCLVVVVFLNDSCTSLDSAISNSNHADYQTLWLVQHHSIWTWILAEYSMMQLTKWLNQGVKKSRVP